jgi:hypothetical protein
MSPPAGRDIREENGCPGPITASEIDARGDTIGA